MNSLPTIIQGGMGIGVSSWRLARRVAELGEFGVVSGTAIDTVLVRELQRGDPHGRLDVLSDYPDREIVDWLADTFHIPGGIEDGEPFKLLPVHRFKPTLRSQRMLSAATFSEVALAKRGHDGMIGVNLMAKLKRYSLPCLYGAMLAGVDAVLMGAGIPIEEARAVQDLAAGKPAALSLEVENPGDAEGPFVYRLDPAALVPEVRSLRCPSFFAIVSSDLLTSVLSKRAAPGSIAGWIIEGAEAGGHNAPPRNKRYDAAENPIYDERDQPDLARIAAIGLPFYLAGGYGTPEKLREALAAGATGVQVGSLFSLTDESGYPATDKEAMVAALHSGTLRIRTDGRTSATGFPFKVMELPGTLGIPELLEHRTRICDLGYLQKAYVDDRGRVQGRCAAEPVADFVRKGGDESDTPGRSCLCNALLANIGLGQARPTSLEGQLFTAGDALIDLPLGSVDDPRFTAEDVIDYLFGRSTRHRVRPAGLKQPRSL